MVHLLKPLPALTALLLITAMAGGAPAQERRDIPALTVHGEPAQAGDAAGIADFIDDYRAAWGMQDTETLMALHTADTEWINAYARIFQGREPLGEFLETRLFPGFDASVSQGEADNMTVISTRHIGNDGAVVHLYTDSDRGAAANPGEPLRRVHFHLVLERAGAGWQIAHTVIMDART
ncbi:hypothetical protein AWH62_06515 [Maricaulis sp. W15]|uniref:Uncharacterized protein (TIGR02246 family) n=1 Tax=Maricaulis maris TaxID=74318 RepID=A0A495D4B5_9PROT|nr:MULTISPECIES: DUF4440 domain-containing protein [Maricaulis]OLF75464.1 hypothetical protein AWH62_06515 [Maricaulis sp. W15]RKQ96763.1 uncharacterized protein (TIGR02246 family) [Maricaulis maris]